MIDENVEDYDDAYLDPRVAPVCDKNVVLVVHSHPSWRVELTIALPWW